MLQYKLVFFMKVARNIMACREQNIVAVACLPLKWFIKMYMRMS